MVAAGTDQAQLIPSPLWMTQAGWEPDGVTFQVRFCEGGKL